MLRSRHLDSPRPRRSHLPRGPRVSAVAALTLAVAVACSSPAPSGSASPRETVGTTTQAESNDTFGVGSGRSGALHVTTASTVINTYAPISTVDATGTIVTIGATTGAAGPFAPGDLVLIWRTAGLGNAPPGNSGPFDLGFDVGRYEYGRVKSVTNAGATVTFTNPLSSAGATSIYATGTQLVRIPEYTTVDVAAGASLAASPWDGGSGGILVFFATTTVTNAGSISADRAGFRGGQVENATSVVAAPACTALTGDDEAVGACGGAHKGEGLDGADYALASNPPGNDPDVTYARGNCANGGGGGDARNAGGGGGGHLGAGGVGGDSSLSDSSRPVGGLGGAVLSYVPPGVVSLGGGGGAGDEDHATATPGAPGGGVILVRAASLVGSGTYSANGGSVSGVAGTDGAGGGGAGGAILLFSEGAVKCGSATAGGGAGGNGGSEPDGPGGGGGGGLVFLEGSDTSECPLFATGGAAGTAPGNGTYGATAGGGGQTSVGNGAAFGGGVCTPAVLGLNHCGGCVADADCPTNDVCNAATNTCGVCSATEQGSCKGKTSACSLMGTLASCVPCTGDLGSGVPTSCLDAAAPYCVTTGTAAGTCGACVPSVAATVCTTAAAPACSDATFTCTTCTGDFGTTATAPCSASTAPYCKTDGTCGVCTSDADCAGSHAGPRCDTHSGACGQTCTGDAECPAAAVDGGTTVPTWCDALTMTPGICEPKVANGAQVPGGSCTASLAARACLSGVCDPTSEECGLAEGASCTSSAECQVGPCVKSGPNAGKCEPCAADSDCKTAKAPACSPTTNQCVACTATNATACTDATPVCDTSKDACAACGGDFGGGKALACPSAEPVCFASSGQCGKCQSSSDCGGAHAGSVCDPATGGCTSTCTSSAECGVGEWCGVDEAGKVCEAQLPNGAPLPKTPAGLSKCTVAVGTEVCASGVCNAIDDRCGPAIDGGFFDGGDGGGGGGGDGGVVFTGRPGTSIEGGACALAGAPGSRSPAPRAPFAPLASVAFALAALIRRRKHS